MKEGSGAGGRGAGAVPVSAAEVATKEMPVLLRSVGNVRPSATVSVKPRVGGLIAEVNFQEGQDVEKGHVLFTIDPKPFEVALARAKATLAQLREQATNAREQVERYTKLGQSGAVSKEQFRQLESMAKAAASGADAAEAAVKEAEIQLGYCSIKSPISGRTGRRMVDAGNVVTANATELVVVNQLKPIEVVFAVPEQALADIMHYLSEGKLKVAATPTGPASRAVEGEVSFVDNAAKAASGTIDVKATFANAELALWPGRFVDVTLTLTIERDAVVVPVAAVQIGQAGQYAFVIKPDKTVEMRQVELARTVNEEAVIRRGLKPGESVVTDGHLRLSPGARVEIKPAIGSTPTAQTAQAGAKEPAVQTP